MRKCAKVRRVHITTRGTRFTYFLGQELKGAIASRGWSARKVAAELGTYGSQLTLYFNGSRSIPADTFASICDLIGVDPADVVDRAYSRLLDEAGPYRPGDAEIIALYTPPSGIPLDAAALRPGYSADEETT